MLRDATKFRNVSFFNAAYRLGDESGSPESDSEEEEKAIKEHEEILKRKSLFDKQAVVYEGQGMKRASFDEGDLLDSEEYKE